MTAEREKSTERRIEGYHPKTKLGYSNGSIAYLGVMFHGQHYIIVKEDHIATEREVNNVPMLNRALRFLRGNQESALVALVTEKEILDPLSIAFHNERLPLAPRGTQGQKEKWPEEKHNKPGEQGPKLYTLLYSVSPGPIGHANQDKIK